MIFNYVMVAPTLETTSQVAPTDTKHADSPTASNTIEVATDPPKFPLAFDNVAALPATVMMMVLVVPAAAAAKLNVETAPLESIKTMSCVAGMVSVPVVASVVEPGVMIGAAIEPAVNAPVIAPDPPDTAPSVVKEAPETSPVDVTGPADTAPVKDPVAPDTAPVTLIESDVREATSIELLTDNVSQVISMIDLVAIMIYTTRRFFSMHII